MHNFEKKKIDWSGEQRVRKIERKRNGNKCSYKEREQYACGIQVRQVNI